MRDEHEGSLVIQARVSNHRRHDPDDDRCTRNEYRRLKGMETTGAVVRRGGTSDTGDLEVRGMDLSSSWCKSVRERRLVRSRLVSVEGVPLRRKIQLHSALRQPRARLPWPEVLIPQGGSYQGPHRYIVFADLPR